MKSLQQLYSHFESFPEEHCVGYKDRTPSSWQQFQQSVSAWQHSFASIADTHIALHHKDALEFSAALLALWRLNKIAIIPASTLPQTIKQLQQLTQTFVGEFNGDVNCVQKSQESLNEFLPPNPLADDNQTALIIFTSGSSGEPAPISKSFRQLNSEIETLESLWGKSLNNSCISGTVSHHHIYGLLFRLLWPLCAGRAFTHSSRDYWEEILKDNKHFSKLTIVTSPAHLNRLPPQQSDSSEWDKLQKDSCAIFSSGAPLSYDDALRAKEQLGHSINEIYGSSETGGIAWRQQSNSPLWQPLPKVKIKQQDNQLAIKSPHLPVELINTDTWFITADQCKFEDPQHFTLLGRSDRIVKVGGKRISLNAIEQQLQQHPWVDESRVLLLPARNDRLGAVVTLSKTGNELLVDQGKKNINHELNLYLQDKIERIAIPRYWRYQAELPRNQQGKTTLADLKSLFSDELQPRFPEVLQQEKLEDNSYRLKLYIPANLYYFNGHFPGHPILPGVTQTHWAIHYGKSIFGDFGPFSHLEVIKFQQVITPSQQINLTLTFHPEKNKLYFSYSSENKQHSSGRAAFHTGRE